MTHQPLDQPLRDANLTRLRTALVEGLEQAGRGELLDGEKVVEEMREMLRKRAKSAKAQSATGYPLPHKQETDSFLKPND